MLGTGCEILNILQNIDGQINSLVSFLNQSNYQTDAKIIETIMNIAKEQNQMASISQLKDFQSKSTAIKEAMVLLNGSKILKATELENLTNKLKTTYGKQNSLFSQLEKDYQLTLNLISKYSSHACGSLTHDNAVLSRLVRIRL